MFNTIKSFFTDLLKVQDPEKGGKSKFSQSRVYLLMSLAVLLGMATSTYYIGTDLNQNFQHALDTVFWLCVLFSSYALIGKGLSYDKMKTVIKRNNDKFSEIIEKQFKDDDQELS